MCISLWAHSRLANSCLTNQRSGQMESTLKPSFKRNECLSLAWWEHIQNIPLGRITEVAGASVNGITHHFSPFPGREVRAMFWPLSETCITNMVLFCGNYFIPSYSRKTCGFAVGFFLEALLGDRISTNLTLDVHKKSWPVGGVSCWVLWKENLFCSNKSQVLYFIPLCLGFWKFTFLRQSTESYLFSCYLEAIAPSLMALGFPMPSSSSGCIQDVHQDVLRMYSGWHISASKSVGYQRVQNEAETARPRLDVHVPSPPGDGGKQRPTSRSSCLWKYPGK